MDNRELKSYLGVLKNNISINRNLIDKALFEDYSKKMPVNFDKINSYIEKYENNTGIYNDNKNIGTKTFLGFLEDKIGEEIEFGFSYEVDFFLKENK